MARGHGRTEEASTTTNGGEGESGVRRGRPGRRTVEERTRAVLELLSGKATVDQLALRFGVQATTIAKWREEALAGVAAALRAGSAKSARELALEKQLGVLEKAFTRLAMKHELVERALATRPSMPGRSAK